MISGIASVVALSGCSAEGSYKTSSESDTPTETEQEYLTCVGECSLVDRVEKEHSKFINEHSMDVDVFFKEPFTGTVYLSVGDETNSETVENRNHVSIQTVHIGGNWPAVLEIIADTDN